MSTTETNRSLTLSQFSQWVRDIESSYVEAVSTTLSEIAQATLSEAEALNRLAANLGQ